MKSLGAQNPDIVINTSLLLQHPRSRRIRRKKNFEFLSPSSPSLKSRHGAKSLRAELRPYHGTMVVINCTGTSKIRKMKIEQNHHENGASHAISPSFEKKKAASHAFETEDTLVHT